LTVLISRKSPVVYVVDDDDSARSGLMRLLRSAGFRVTAFSSGQEYLDFEFLEPKAILILDVRMPGMSGLDLQKRLQNNGVALPIIFLTAFEDPQARKEAMAAGASAFLNKPVDEKVLFAAIKRALESLGPNNN
jgi:FixJ family two-component response regulator